MANYQSTHTGAQIDAGVDKANKALIKPDSAPASTSLVAVDNSNAQTMLTIGDGLSVENGKLKATGGSGGGMAFNVTIHAEQSADVYYLDAAFKIQHIVIDASGTITINALKIVSIITNTNFITASLSNTCYVKYYYINNSALASVSIYLTTAGLSYNASMEYYFNGDVTLNFINSQN